MENYDQILILDDLSVKILEAAENATEEDARIRLKVIKHYIRAIHGDKDINMSVKRFLDENGIEAWNPSSVFLLFPLALLTLMQQHKCKGSICVQKLKKRTARNLEKMKKQKALEKKKNSKKAARQAKKGKGKNSSKNVSSSSEDEPSISLNKHPPHYV